MNKRNLKERHHTPHAERRFTLSIATRPLKTCITERKLKS